MDDKGAVEVSLRDYFAGNAMVAIVNSLGARFEPDRRESAADKAPDPEKRRALDRESIALTAYRIADAMLRAREEKP